MTGTFENFNKVVYSEPTGGNVFCIQLSWN